MRYKAKPATRTIYVKIPSRSTYDDRGKVSNDDTRDRPAFVTSDNHENGMPSNMPR